MIRAARPRSPRPPRTSIGRIALLASLALLAGCGAEASAPEATNVILISLDTTRADRLSSYGAARPTPALDAFAAESVRFEDCLSQSCVTAPSHLSLLTGHYVHRHGLNDNGEVRTPPYTLASLLQERGWATAAFTGHGLLQAKYGHGVGFDVFESWVGPEPEEWPFWRNVDEVLPNALGWLDQHQQEPFFLFVHGYDPHQPYWPPEPWRSEYAGWYEGSLNTQRLRAPDYKKLLRQGRFGSHEKRYVNDLYDGEIASADQVLGGFLEELDRRGLLDSSLVVFTSDHGEALGDHERVGHGAMPESVLHVPLVIRFPDGRYAGVRSDPTQSIDIVPTVLSALGIVAPGGLQGIDLMPLVRDGSSLEPERMRVAQVKSNFAVRFDGRWKFFARLEGDQITRQQLFDLKNDPDEARNLYETPEGRERYNRLLDRFLAWRAKTLAEDAALAGVGSEATDMAGDQELLEALGYVDNTGGGGDDD